MWDSTGRRASVALGHRRIACLAWPLGSLSGDARFAGYFDTLRAAGIAPRPEWIAQIHNVLEAGAQAGETLMALPDAARPTALVAFSDVMAIGAMNYLEAAGLRIGEDVAVTGFDDEPLAALCAHRSHRCISRLTRSPPK